MYFRDIEFWPSTIYVLDTKACNIRVFNENGKFLRVFGKKTGPGELVSGRYIQITPQKEIMIHDLYARKLVFFSLEGKYLQQVSLAKFMIIFLPKLDSKGNIVGECYWKRKGRDKISLKEN